MEGTNNDVVRNATHTEASYPMVIFQIKDPDPRFHGSGSYRLLLISSTLRFDQHGADLGHLRLHLKIVCPLPIRTPRQTVFSDRI